MQAGILFAVFRPRALHSSAKPCCFCNGSSSYCMFLSSPACPSPCPSVCPQFGQQLQNYSNTQFLSQWHFFLSKCIFLEVSYCKYYGQLQSLRMVKLSGEVKIEGAHRLLCPPCVGMCESYCEPS